MSDLQKAIQHIHEQFGFAYTKNVPGSSAVMNAFQLPHMTAFLEVNRKCRI
ncbi:MAG: hypothetical protein JWQ25_1888 [Daejeonella sp.]|nr:hypothetical protein [Daejeonella sp.]